MGCLFYLVWMGGFSNHVRYWRWLFSFFFFGPVPVVGMGFVVHEYEYLALTTWRNLLPVSATRPEGMERE